MAVASPRGGAATGMADGADLRGDRAAGLRLGLLFGPSVYGVTAAAVALPHAAASLDVGYAAASWVLTVHALALGVAGALFGRVAGARGVHRTLILGTALLLVGAGLVVVASSLGVLLVGRAALACGSGATVACALTLAARVEDARRAGVLSWFGVALAVFAGSATLVGGLVTDLVTWRLTLVLPALSLVGVGAVLARAPRNRGSREPVDLLGAGQLALAAGALLVLIQTPVLAPSPPLLLGVVGIAALASAGLWHRVHRRPTAFVPRALATDRVLARAALVGAGVFCGLFAAMYVVPRLLTDDHGWSVVTVGAALLPGALVGALLSRAAGRSPRASRDGRVLLGGTALAFAATLAAAGVVGGAWPLSVVAVSVGFAAFALTQVVITNQASAHLPLHLRGASVGLLNLAFMAGGAVGTAAASALAEPLGATGALTCVAAGPLLSGVLALRR